MRWSLSLALLVACNGGSSETDDTGELELLPELGSLVEGVHLDAFLVVDRVGSQWVEFNTGSSADVLLPSSALDSALKWSSDHCESYEQLTDVPSAQGPGSLTLSTSLTEVTATYEGDQYELSGMVPVPYADTDSLGLSDGAGLAVEVEAPPALGVDALGEASGLATVLSIPHDYFDAVLVRVYDATSHSGHCLYGRSDMTRVGDGCELPLVDAGSRDGMLLADGGTVLVYLVNLEMTDGLLAGQELPVVAARGLAVMAVSL